jgi:HSF-type DNA-binding
MAPVPVEFLNDSATDWSSCNSVSASEQDEFDKSIAKGGVTVPFPWKLHNMLDAMDSEGDHSIVQWQPHGRAFVVHDPKQFVSIIMPKYFNQTKVRLLSPGLSPANYCSGFDTSF